MRIIFKISNLNQLAQVKEELNALSLCQGEDFTHIDLEMNVKNLSLGASGAPSYDIENEVIELSFSPSQEKCTLSSSQLEQSEYLLTLLDELMMEELSKQSQHLFNKKDEQGWKEAVSEMEEIISNSPSMDSLYHRVRNSDEWGSKKNYFLYKILMNERKVLDVDLVYDFIDNFFEIRFADIILHYPLRQEYIQAILSDTSINPVVKEEYAEKNLEAEPVGEILATHSPEIIRNYFFNKLMKLRHKKNFSTEYNAILKSPDTPSDVIEGMTKITDIIFIYDLVLSHPNCPEKLLKQYALTAPAYGVSIMKNPHTPGYLIHEMVTHDLAYEPEEEFKALVLTHQNTDLIDKEMIQAKEEKLEVYNKTLSKENLDAMLKDTSIKFNLNEILDYANKLRRDGQLSMASIEAIEASIKEVQSKMNHLLEASEIVKDFTSASFNLEKTQVFLNSPAATEEVCTAIIKEELERTNTFIENPLIDEISKKHPNLLVMECRPEVMKRIKEVAVGRDAHHVADQIINNIYFLTPRFNLSSSEKEEIKEKLLNNPHLASELKDKVKKAM